jgi:hypothetical protein
MYSTNQNQQILEAIGELSQQQIQIVLRFIQTLQPKKLSSPNAAPFDPLAIALSVTFLKTQIAIIN